MLFEIEPRLLDKLTMMDPLELFLSNGTKARLKIIFRVYFFERAMYIVRIFKKIQKNSLFSVKNPNLKKSGAMTFVLKVDSICSTLTKLYLVALGATPALLTRQVNPSPPNKT